MTRAYRFLLLALLLGLSASLMGVAWAQSPPTTGTPPFGSFGGGPEVINLANLNVNWDVPVLAKAGRGGFNFTYDLRYDSSVWTGGVSSGTSLWYPFGNWGWRGVTEASTGYLSYTSQTHFACSIWNPDDRRYDKYLYTLYTFSGYGDPFGIPHYLNVTLEGNYTPCSNDPNLPNDATGTISDGSGYAYYLQAYPSQANESILPASGGVIHPPLNSVSGAGNGTDRNGNQITVNGSGQFFDTLSSTTPVLTVTGSGTPTSPRTFTYTAPSGANASYTMKYTAYTIKTNFGCPNISEYGPTSNNLVSEIDLPDGSKYTFGYEATPGYAGDVTGRLASVILPTGGTISYTYSGGNNGVVCADGSTATLTRTTPDGTWTYAHSESGTAWTTLITDPQGNQTNMNFQGIYETQRQVSQLINGSQSLLRQWTTCYNGNTSNCNSTAITLPITQRTVTDQYGTTGLQCKHNYLYNSVGGLTEQDDYDYGPGAPGALLRQLLVTYASLGNITAFRQQVTVKDGNGNIKAQTNYNYDETTPAATSGIAQHTSVSGSRGNLTSVNQWVNTSGSNLTTHSAYYDTGVVSTATAANGAVTTYNYSTCADAFPTSVNEPLGMSRSFAWNCTGGVLTSVTDENNQVTSTTYSDPYFWRPASQNFPDGGQTSWTYNSPTSVTTTTKMNASQNIVSTVLLDGLGRTSQTQLNSDPQGVDYTVTTHDALGRTYQVYNPTRCNPPTTNCGESTWGITSYQYDALSHPTSITDPDGSVATASYPNNTMTVTDEAGKKRQSTFDALGRTTQITEDPGGLGYVTVYGFDALDNLSSVVQNGSRQRTFVYDSLSRMTSETNPESGTVTYKFDSDTNCSSPNSFAGQLVSRTDARNIRTCNQYDALNRLTQKTYNDGTPMAYYFYDQTSASSHSLTNPIGRLTTEGTYANSSWLGATNFSYDAMGRVAFTLQSTQQDWALVTSSTYDLAGDLTSLTYPSGRVVTFTPDTAGRVGSATFQSIGGTNVGYNYLSSATYAPNSAPSSLALGNGLSATATYNNLLQLGSQEVSSGMLTALNRSFGYTSGQNNGNVMSVTDNLQPNRTQSFSYDSLNRIFTAQANATSGPDCWAQQFGYDAWGNLLNASPTRSGCPMTQLSIGLNANNQITNTGFSYDAAGNLLSDGTNNYAYDAESHIKTMNGTGAVYTYDGYGQRVYKQVGSDTTEYIYLSGLPLAERKGNGDWSDYIYANGQLLARADTYEDGILIQGNNCSNCGWQYTYFNLNATAVSGYTIQSGDKLFWRQYQSNARGGTGIFFSDGTNNVWSSTDQNGSYTNDDPNENSWDYRYVDLSSYAGKVISWIGIDNDGNSPSGSWSIVFRDIALVSADGTVRAIYNGSPSVSASFASSTSGVTGVSVTNRHLSNVGSYPPTTTSYYSSDHLGSARMLLSYSGYPTWSATYLPFGQEWNPQITVNHYKFTGLERDSETGLDHTWFRQYSSSLGRWMHPDPAGLAAADPTNPQSWNRYAHVLGNPIVYIDPLGLTPACYTVENRDANQPQDFKGGGPLATGDSTEADPQYYPNAGCGRGGGGGGVWVDGGYAGDDSGLGVGFPIGGGDLASRIALMQIPVSSSYYGWHSEVGPSGTIGDLAYDSKIWWFGWGSSTIGSAFFVLTPGPGGGGNASDSWWGTAVKTFFTVPYRKPGETFTACWNRAASDTLVGMGVPRDATPGTEALLGSAGTVGLFSSVKSIWALGNWVRPSSYLAKAMGAGSAGVRAARISGQAMAASLAAEVGLRTGAALDCAIPVN